MAGSVNKVVLVGNLGRDPEVRYAPDGTIIVNLLIATSENWKDKISGERREKTEWHRVVIFNDRLCRVAADLLDKGDKVYIEGAVQTRKWTDQRGQDKFFTEIVLQRYRGELTLMTPTAGKGGREGDGGDSPGLPPAGGNAKGAMSPGDLDGDSSVLTPHGVLS